MSRLLLLILLVPGALQAEDLTTNSGKTYKDIHDVIIRGEQVSFSTADDIIKIPLSDLPLELQTKYLGKSDNIERNRKRLADQAAAETNAKTEANRAQIITIANRTLEAIGGGMKSARTHGPGMFSAQNAATLDKLEIAQKIASQTGRPIGFLLVEGRFFGAPCDAAKSDPQGAFAHLYTSFEPGIVLVFVRADQLDDLKKLPALVAGIVTLPHQSLPAPRLVITDPGIRNVIADLQISEKDTVDSRDKLFYATALKIKEWYQSMVSAVGG